MDAGEELDVPGDGFDEEGRTSSMTAAGTAEDGREGLDGPGDGSDGAGRTSWVTAEGPAGDAG